MEKKTLVIATNFLRQAFPRLEINTPILWEMLQDLDDRPFLMAVKDLCRHRTEIYPGTNMIALLRDGAREIVIREWREKQNERPKNALEECSPPPPEWGELKSKIGGVR